jgi:hypothetical protein
LRSTEDATILDGRQTGRNNVGRVELLLMTLTEVNPAQSLVASLFANPSHGARHDKATLAVCEKASEQDLPTPKSPWRNFTPLVGLDRRTWCTPICGS